MSLIYSQPFTTSFATVPSLQANGTIVTGASSPQGITNNIQIVNGIYQSAIYSTDATTATGIRAECVFAASALGNENWYVFDMMIPSATWSNLGHISVAQVHCIDSITAAVPWLLSIHNNQFVSFIPQSDPPTQGANSTLTIPRTFTYDRWHTVCMHTKWLNNDFGFMDVIIDGVIAQRVLNRGTAYNGDAPYFKLGLYDYAHNNDFGASTMCQYRNLFLWQGTGDGYEQVLGSPPLPNISTYF